jgi:hypothetical protein
MFDGVMRDNWRAISVAVIGTHTAVAALAAKEGSSL